VVHVHVDAVFAYPVPLSSVFPSHRSVVLVGCHVGRCWVVVIGDPSAHDDTHYSLQSFMVAEILPQSLTTRMTASILPTTLTPLLSTSPTA
jgi:hypothetical protein